MNVFQLIRRHESERLKPYCDRCGKDIRPTDLGFKCGCHNVDFSVGQISIGVGRDLSETGISWAESAQMLIADWKEARDHVGGYAFFHVLDEVRQAACIDLCLNVGRGGFDQFKMFLMYMGVGDLPSASAQLLNSLAAKQAPRRYKELSDMIATGKWPTGDY